MKTIVPMALAAMMLATSADAQGGLSAPIVVLTPVVAKNADALSLTEAQRADVQAWIATKPKERKAVEARALSERDALRTAILSGAPQSERDALAKRIGETETELVLMRSACVDHWRDVLSKEQFAKVLIMATAK